MKNLKDKLINRKIKKPDRFIFPIVWSGLRHAAKKRNVRYVYKVDFKKYKKQPIILLAQHASRDDYMSVLTGFYRNDMHVVMGYQNFFQKGLYPLLLKLGVISKFLYQPDPTATMHMLRVIKNGHCLVLFPEGIQSTSGSAHPINPATVKLLKKCRVPVILCSSHGAYLTRPRYSAEIRKGQMTYTYELLFDKDDFDKYTESELSDILWEKFKYNEFEYQKTARIPFVGKCENIKDLDRIIYKCPHCGKEFAFNIEKDTMRCTECGYAVRMDSYYQLTAAGDTELYFDNIDSWYKWQRREVAREVLQKDFAIGGKVKALAINLQKLQNDCLDVGDGEIIITDHFITYTGTYCGEQKQLVFDIKNVPSFVFAPTAHEIDMVYENEYYNFRLTENPLHAVKWMLATEEIHNIYDAAWREASKKAYDE